MRILRNAIVAIIAACTLAGAASASDQGERYIVVLKAVKSDQPLRDDDVRKLGGTVDNRTWDKIFVTLPPGAAEALRHNPAVRYMQAVGASAAFTAPPTLMRLHPMPNQSPPSWSSGMYSYDGSGNIYKIGAAGAESGDGMATTYSYDLLSRLKKVDSVRSATGAVGTPRTENYSYDVYGNLTLTTEGDGSQRNLTVAASSNRYQTSPDTGMAAVYDVAGRMTNYGTDVYKYDGVGSLGSDLRSLAPHNPLTSQELATAALRTRRALRVICSCGRIERPPSKGRRTGGAGPTALTNPNRHQRVR